MIAARRRWLLRPPPPPDATLPGRSPIVAGLLWQRGYRDAASADAFLAADYRSGLHDPLAMQGMQAAAHRIARAIAHHEPMAVYGDFDTDGVTAVTLLQQALPAMGGDVRPYIPHRLREGYGLNQEAIRTLYDQGVRLLITVDCGISNAAEVAFAREIGLDVIVTDHHHPPPALPDAAVAVVNPRQPGCAYPYKDLVGVGIAFKLVQAMVRQGVALPLRGRDLLDVVALGTVTDMGPLTGENRVLVKAGLEALNTTSRPGLRALINAAGVQQGRITAATIGYVLGPRINAAGRLDDALRAYQLLLADDLASADRLATELNETNRRRQDLTRDVQQAARSRAAALGKLQNRIIVLDGEDYPAGVVGLVAGKLVEELGRPVLLIERGPEHSRGSARSVAGFNMVEALHTCADLFVRFGGHAAAAGFTIHNANLPSLEQRLLALAEHQITDDMLHPSVSVDLEVPVEAMNWELLDELSLLEPFGQANPAPVFLSRRVAVRGAWPRGAENRHLKLRLGLADGRTLDAIAFGMGSYAMELYTASHVDLVYTLERNEWQGAQVLQLNVRDLATA